jgi:hypothetical protein
MESSLKSMSSYLTKENPQELSQNHICSVKTREQSDQGTSWTLWEEGYSQVQLHKMQVEDPYIGPILEWKEMGHKTKIFLHGSHFKYSRLSVSLHSQSLGLLHLDI